MNRIITITALALLALSAAAQEPADTIAGR